MRTILLWSALAAGLCSGAALAAEDDDEFYKTKNCFACHRIDRNTVGPSFKSVAARYAGDATATASTGSEPVDRMLAKKIREGGSGVWGATPMPPQSQVSEDEALRLARWILGLK